MPALDAVLSEKITLLARKGQKRAISETLRHDGIFVTRGGRRLISFSCNDYYGLSAHPEVIAASVAAVNKYGAGAGASRLISGNHPLYSELEELLAEEKNARKALVFGSGYLANIGLIPTLVGRNDVIIADKYIHACMIDAAKLSQATLLRFSHNNIEHLKLLLKENRHEYQNCLIVVESVFSMDGDCAPLAEIKEIAKQYDAWLMTDSAHELANNDIINNQHVNNELANNHLTINQLTNNQSTNNQSANDEMKSGGASFVSVGTLSKSFGSYGGYICGSDILIEYLQSAARSLIYSTALPPAAIAAAIASIHILRRDESFRIRPLENARYFTNILGLKEAQSAIVPLIIGEEDKAVAAAENLADNGFYVAAIRPPTVSANSSRLRFTFSALHSREDIERVAECVAASALNKTASAETESNETEFSKTEFSKTEFSKTESNETKDMQ